MTWKSRFIQWLIRKRAGSDFIGFEDTHIVFDAAYRRVDSVRAYHQDKHGIHVLIACTTDDGECVAVGTDRWGKKTVVDFYGYIPGGRVVQRNAD